jgi:glc operon protein GlcG
MNATKSLLSICVLALCSLLCLPASAQLADKKVLTLEGAKKVAAAAEAEARKNGWNVVIAVVDDGGSLLYLQRIDGTQTGSIDVAIQKARTAQAFKRPTRVFEDAIAGGRVALVALHGALPLEGGVPKTARSPRPARRRSATRLPVHPAGCSPPVCNDGQSRCQCASWALSHDSIRCWRLRDVKSNVWTAALARSQVSWRLASCRVAEIALPRRLSRSYSPSR